MAVINVKDENVQNLAKIQNVITFEEGKHVSLDEALARVLAFYKKYVPYN